MYSHLTSKPSNFHAPKRKILVAPLNWGLGHATRCIPIIRELLRQQAEVVIAADGHPLVLLQQEFPELTFIELPSYAIHYPANGNMAVAMLRQLPKIIRKIRSEHKALQEIITRHGITVVISDNRYGLWTKSVPCVFITHQIVIKCPPTLFFLEPLLYCINKFFIKHYTQCWIPDVASTENLSGKLSHQYALPKNAIYIGPLSRFEGMKAEIPIPAYDIMAIVSGPEPQRSIFEEKLTAQLSVLPQPSLLIRGVPGTTAQTQAGCVTIINHLNAQHMLNYMSAARVIISRTGYSTIMDLITIGKIALLVPTPGQTEQEYLAAYYTEKSLFYCTSQNEFNLETHLKKIAEFKKARISVNKELISKAVRQLLALA